MEVVDLNALGAQTYNPDAEIEVLKQCKYLIGVLIFAVGEDKKNRIVFCIVLVLEKDKAKYIWREMMSSLRRR